MFEYVLHVDSLFILIFMVKLEQLNHISLKLYYTFDSGFMIPAEPIITSLIVDSTTSKESYADVGDVLSIFFFAWKTYKTFYKSRLLQNQMSMRCLK